MNVPNLCHVIPTNAIYFTLCRAERARQRSEQATEPYEKLLLNHYYIFRSYSTPEGKIQLHYEEYTSFYFVN